MGVFPVLTLDRQAAHGSRADEPISLPGEDIQNIINNRRGVSIDQDAIFGGLADTAKSRGYSWCDICELFAVHDSLSSEAASDADKYAVCTTSPRIMKWLGPAPDPANPSSCNFVPATTCPPGQIVSSMGLCITPPCAAPLVQNFDHTCQVACDKHFRNGVEIDAVVDGVCVDIGAVAGTSELGGGGSGGGAGTTDAGGDPAGAGDGGCLPACIVSLKASCAETAAKSCVTQTPMAGLIASCFDNGVKVQQTKPNATSSTIEVHKPDGSLCYRSTLISGSLT
jgi:hypothetical protein